LLVRVLLGEMGESLLLASARVQAIKLQGAGFRFQHPELRGALGTILGRS
jgi:NAD dependent epimerase/dehydratase family enzyme